MQDGPSGVLPIWLVVLLCVLGPLASGCDAQPAPENPSEERRTYDHDTFAMGVDLSYVNQVLDHGGTYRDTTGRGVDPYAHFADRGANVVRLRLWHRPTWVREEVYENPDVPLYSGRRDVARSIQRAKAAGLAVNLDFHYSDTWADPETQKPPAAWRDIEQLDVLADSLYQYTERILSPLARKGLMPEMVQIGNETNCGMMFSDAPPEFPKLNVCDGHWNAFGTVVNSGIQAVRDVGASTDVEPKVILHVAQPENVKWWFDNVTTKGGVTDFDVVGLSYYPSWSDVPLHEISDYVNTARTSYDREVMVVETAYPWTTENADEYDNIFGEESLIDGYPATPEGQKRYVVDLIQEVIDGGGTGVMYWEPAWISSDMKDLWGQGSSWENNAFYNFQGRALPVFEALTHPYSFGESGQ